MDYVKASVLNPFEETVPWNYGVCKTASRTEKVNRLWIICDG